MLENTWYSVISPESCSSILWRSWAYKEQAAEALKLTAADMLQHRLIDGIIDEPLGGAHKNLKMMASALKATLVQAQKDLDSLAPEARIHQRIEKFGAMGAVEE